MEAWLRYLIVFIVAWVLIIFLTKQPRAPPSSVKPALSQGRRLGRQVNPNSIYAKSNRELCRLHRARLARQQILKTPRRPPPPPRPRTPVIKTIDDLQSDEESPNNLYVKWEF